ncbi:MAG: hypothetical protein AAGE65_06625 [Planctomycetota bacterium]
MSHESVPPDVAEALSKLAAGFDLQTTQQLSESVEKRIGKATPPAFPIPGLPLSVQLAIKKQAGAELGAVTVDKLQALMQTIAKLQAAGLIQPSPDAIDAEPDPRQTPSWVNTSTCQALSAAQPEEEDEAVSAMPDDVGLTPMSTEAWRISSLPGTSPTPTSAGWPAQDPHGMPLEEPTEQIIGYEIQGLLANLAKRSRYHEPPRCPVIEDGKITPAVQQQLIRRLGLEEGKSAASLDTLTADLFRHAKQGGQIPGGRLVLDNGNGVAIVADAP